MNKSVTMYASDSDDEEYEVTVMGLRGPTPDTFDEPGDAGEIEFSPIVTRILKGRKVEELSFDDFVTRYADHHAITESRARDRIDYAATMDVADQLAADYEDSREAAYEERSVH